MNFQYRTTTTVTDAATSPSPLAPLDTRTTFIIAFLMLVALGLGTLATFG